MLFSVGRLVGFRVVEGTHPIGKIDIVIVTQEHWVIVAQEWLMELFSKKKIQV